MNTYSSHQRTRKVNTKGKYLHTQMLVLMECVEVPLHGSKRRSKD